MEYRNLVKIAANTKNVKTRINQLGLPPIRTAIPMMIVAIAPLPFNVLNLRAKYARIMIIMPPTNNMGMIDIEAVSRNG